MDSLEYIAYTIRTRESGRSLLLHLPFSANPHISAGNLHDKAGNP